MGSSLSFFWMLVQTIFALAVVCGLAYVIFRIILPRLAGGTFGTASMVRIVDRVSLDARRSLLVIEVAGKFMLVATSENGVQMISELDAEATRAAETETATARGGGNVGVIGKKFADKLTEVVGKGRDGGVS